MMVGGADRGQLITTVRKYYFGDDSAGMSPAYVTTKLCDFLVDTKWEDPWDVASHDPSFYALDLPNRAKRMSATRDQWPSLIRPRLAMALPRLFPLDLLLEDVARQPMAMSRELVAIGDAVLPGDTGHTTSVQ